MVSFLAQPSQPARQPASFPASQYSSQPASRPARQAARLPSQAVQPDSRQGLLKYCSCFVCFPMWFPVENINSTKQSFAFIFKQLVCNEKIGSMENVCFIATISFSKKWSTHTIEQPTVWSLRRFITTTPPPSPWTRRLNLSTSRLGLFEAELPHIFQCVWANWGALLIEFAMNDRTPKAHSHSHSQPTVAFEHSQSQS